MAPMGIALPMGTLAVATLCRDIHGCLNSKVSIVYI